MNFINRKNELKLLEEYFTLSQKKLFLVAISGLRRVGKTTLVKQFMINKPSIYFFVYEHKISTELLREFSNELKNCGIISELESILSWESFFKVIFTRCKNMVVVFDEFQNFYSIDMSIFSIIQKICDENQENPLNIIILGSMMSLFKQIFENKKEPLFGRIAAKIHLQPFDLYHSIKALSLLNFKDIEEMFMIYGIFGGFPKYYAAIEQFNLGNKEPMEIIEYLLLTENAPLENEVQEILKQEFGKRSPLYYAILHAIATGNSKLNEIASKVGRKESSLTRQINELENNFGFIESYQPLGFKKSSRYKIKHPLIKFWFMFVYEKFSQYIVNDSREMKEEIKKTFTTFFGRRFEEICKEIILLLNDKKKLPFKIYQIGNWWGTERVENQRKEIEIDLIGTDKNKENFLFIECKWSSEMNTTKIFKRLKEKSSFFQPQTEEKRFFYCLFAKSFKPKNLEENEILFDIQNLKDLLIKD